LPIKPVPMMAVRSFRMYFTLSRRRKQSLAEMLLIESQEHGRRAYGGSHNIARRPQTSV
jgi:hypothetical protein